MIFNKKKIPFDGALHDTEDIRDYKREEIAFTGVPVWKEKKEYKHYTIRNQFNSYSCVAQSVATLLEALLEKNGKGVPVSALPIYVKRTNVGGGMSFREGMDIGSKNGSTLEYLVPSQDMNEEQMNDASNITMFDHCVADIISGASYLAVPFDFNAIASVLDDGNPMIVGFVWDYNEWDREFPEIRETSKKQYHHSATIVDYALINGVRYLVIQDSWGKNKGKNGLRFINEKWLSRMTACWYYDLFLLKETPIGNKDSFDKDLEFGMRDNDVVRLQDFLKEQGYFPINTESTGYYGAITVKAVRDFQLENGIISSAKDAGAGRFGPLSRKYVNK
jgi:hypothetical protein